MRSTNNATLEYDLSYKEVQEILGVSRRTVQNLAADGKLSKKMIKGPSGQEIARFSRAEVEGMKGVKQTSAEPQQTKLARYETGIGMFQKLLAEKDDIIVKKDDAIQAQVEEIKSLTHSNGKLEGELQAVKGQITQFADAREELDKHKQRASYFPALTLMILILAFLLGVLAAPATREGLVNLFIGR